MINFHTIVRIVDNSGARFARCIKVPISCRNKTAVVGDIITIVLQTVRTHKAVKKKEIFKALILRSTKKYKRKGVGFFLFDTNSVILLNKKGHPFAKRFYGPVVDEMRRNPKYSKIVSLTKLTI
jgi:large subunit ribosomal protein L14